MSAHAISVAKAYGKSIYVGSLATASAALLLQGHPLKMFGGAIFGAIHVISTISLTTFRRNHLNPLITPWIHRYSSTAAKIHQLFLLLSYGAAWGAFKAAGVSLTLSHVVSLSAVAICCEILLTPIFTKLGIINN